MCELKDISHVQFLESRYKHEYTGFCMNIYFFFSFFFFFFALGILVPQPGIEPGPTAVEAQSPNYWLTQESPIFISLKENTWE